MMLDRLRMMGAMLRPAVNRMVREYRSFGGDEHAGVPRRHAHPRRIALVGLGVHFAEGLSVAPGNLPLQ